MDIIDVLEANTSGESRTIIKDYQITSLADPLSILNAIWRELFNTFGNADKIYFELERKLLTFNPIKNTNDVNKLKELVRVCRLILCNFSTVLDLAIFNTGVGLAKIYPLLPSRVFESWRHKVAILKKSGSHPDVATSVSHLDDTIEDLTAIQLPVESKSVIKSFVSKSEPVVPNNNYSNSDSIISKLFCAFHNTKTHDTGDCRNLAKKSYPERFEFITRKKLCYSCLGTTPERTVT